MVYYLHVRDQTFNTRRALPPFAINTLRHTREARRHTRVSCGYMIHMTSDFRHYQHWRCTCITIVRSTLPLSVIVMYYPYFLKPDRTGQFNPVYWVKPVRFGLSHQVAANPGFFQNQCTSSFENHLVQCWTGIIGLSGSRQGPGYQWKCWFFIDGELRHCPPLGRSETKYIVCSGMK